MSPRKHMSSKLSLLDKILPSPLICSFSELVSFFWQKPIIALQDIKMASIRVDVNSDHLISKYFSKRRTFSPVSLARSSSSVVRAADAWKKWIWRKLPESVCQPLRPLHKDPYMLRQKNGQHIPISALENSNHLLLARHRSTSLVLYVVPNFTFAICCHMVGNL